MSGSWKILAAVAMIVCLSAPAQAEGPAGFVGQWERKVDKNVTQLALTEDNRLHLTFRTKDAIFTLHGDYHVTRDGLVYGVVTSVESDEEEIEEFVDQPFSVRCRVDEGALVITRWRVFGKHTAGPEHKVEDFRGRYRNMQPANVVSPPPSAAAPSINSTASYSPSRERIPSPAPQPARKGLVPAGR